MLCNDLLVSVLLTSTSRSFFTHRFRLGTRMLDHCVSTTATAGSRLCPPSFYSTAYRNSLVPWLAHSGMHWWVRLYMAVIV
ncbi:hypothetical protein DPMN_034496 [Dreissena polymorpha]|uniref:Uncharacterized protein n=1 Tax=Dreissena polymorpha TaxID=45954 RepID=A0A9D4M8R9_DREPO|nr:hypothetical protein DPMN_034496 [Dreissena polymorpha]